MSFSHQAADERLRNASEATARNDVRAPQVLRRKSACSAGDIGSASRRISSMDEGLGVGIGATGAVPILMATCSSGNDAQDLRALQHQQGENAHGKWCSQRTA